MSASADPSRAGERSWLLTLGLNRAFVTLIFMTYTASLPTLAREWSMTGAQAGFVQTSFLIGFAVSLFVTSWACDHVGAKRMFLWFNWLAAAAALAFAFFAGSFEQAIWLHALVGVTQGGCYTPAIMLVARKLPPARRGAGVGWMLAGMSAGYVGSISLAHALIAVADYQVAFLVCAVGTVAGAALGNVAAARVDNRTAATRPATRPAAPRKDRRSLLLTVGYMGHCWELFGMWAWVPAFLIASLGGRFDLGAIGLGIAIAVALHVSGLVASVTMGQASDRYGRRAVLLALAALGALCSFGFGWSGELPAAVLLCFTVVYGFVAVGDSGVLSTAMTEAVAGEVLGRALAVRSILGIGAGAAAPSAFGAVLDLSPHGWGWAFVLMGLGGVVATVCAALLPADGGRARPGAG